MNRTDLSGVLWRKSSYSNGQANCVEIAALKGGRTTVVVRDSKAPEGAALNWRSALKRGKSSPTTCAVTQKTAWTTTHRFRDWKTTKRDQAQMVAQVTDAT